MKFSKVKFGIVGCSNVAKKSMLPAMKSSELVEIAIIGSRSEEKAIEHGKIFGITTHGTYDDVVNNEDVDAVYVSLPATLHKEWTIKALQAGKHVICEKPAAISFDEAKRMLDASEKNKVRLMENFTFKYHPQHQKVIDLINKGTLGKLITFNGVFSYPFPATDNIKLKKELGGGVMNDSIPYPVSASRMIFQEEPVKVACELKIDPELGIDTQANILMIYSEGKVAFASSAFGGYFQSTYNILGSEGQVSMKRAYAIPRDMTTSIYLNKNDKITEIVVEPVDQFKIALEDFCKEITSNQKTKNYEEDLLAQAKVLEAARLSSEEQRFVKISEIK